MLQLQTSGHLLSSMDQWILSLSPMDRGMLSTTVQKQKGEKSQLDSHHWFCAT
jgi:hypothetical protein